MDPVKESGLAGPAAAAAKSPRLEPEGSPVPENSSPTGGPAGLFLSKRETPRQAGQERARLWGYGLALSAVAGAVLLRHLILVYCGATPAYITFYPAVVLAALLGGLGPGLVATTLSAVWAASFIFPPAWHAGGAIGLAIFTVMGVATSVLAESVDRNRRKAAIASSSSARYARSLLEASLDPLVTIGPDGQITDVNQATELITGIPRRSLRGTDFAACFTEPEKAHAGYRQALAEGQVADCALSIRHVSGKVSDVLYNARVHRDEQGAVAGVFAAARDVTPRKRAEEALRASEEHYRGFVERNAAGVVRTTAQGRVLQCNQAFADTLRYDSREELLRTPVVDLYLHPADRDTLLALLKQRGSIQNHEVCLKRKDGSPVWALCSIAAVEEPGGTVIEATDIDITDRKLAEAELADSREHLEGLVASRTAELQASNRLLEDSNKELETFAYSVSHDLRAPLRAVDGFSRILLEDHAAQLDAEGQRMLHLVRQGSKKLAQLIDDILAFSRAGRQEMACGSIDMNELVRAAREELEPASGGREVHWEIQALPAAHGDAWLIQRVWINLLDNALKFTGHNPAPNVQVGAQAGPHETVYFIKDNGVGFDMQYANKLFGLFQRLHSESEFRGTGIGLAIVQRIVARHGGRVWAEGKVNEGATFYFALPRREVNLERSRSPARSEGGS